MTTLEHRVGYLEAAYEHLATKEDVAELKAEFKSDIGNLRAGVQERYWRTEG